MKATINKSAVMKRAWSIFRGKNRDYNYNFSASLRRAWAVEKESIAYGRNQNCMVSNYFKNVYSQTGYAMIKKTGYIEPVKQILFLM